MKNCIEEKQQNKINYIFTDVFGKELLKMAYEEKLLTENEYRKALIEFKKQLDKMLRLSS